MIYLRPLAFALLAGFEVAALPLPATKSMIKLLESRNVRHASSTMDLTHADFAMQTSRGLSFNERTWARPARRRGPDGSDQVSPASRALHCADLRNSRLIGTDLRSTDLTGALWHPTRWTIATGLDQGSQKCSQPRWSSMQELMQHRPGDEAEQLFNAAIEACPDEPLSWVARGLSRGEQDKNKLASRDFVYASQLFAKQGDDIKAEQLLEASRLIYNIDNESDPPSGNGIGSAFIGGALSTVQALAPIALKALMPMIP